MIVLALFLLLFPASAHAWTPSLMSSGGVSCPANDGHLNDANVSGLGTFTPPGGSAQMPTALNGYARTITSTLGCQVAGVSYAVGTGNPSYTGHTAGVDSMSGLCGGNVSYNASTPNYVQIGGGLSADCTIDGWLFNGMDIRIASGAYNVIISHSKIVLPETDTASCCGGGHIQSDNNTTGKVVLVDDEITATSAIYAHIGYDIFTSGAGNVYLLYDYIHDTPDSVWTQTTNGAALVYRYNLIVNAGIHPGVHYNVTQWSDDGTGLTDSMIVQFNTFVGYIVGDPSGDIVQAYINNNAHSPNYVGDKQSSPDIGYNTFIFPTTNPNAIARTPGATLPAAQTFYVPGSYFTYYQNVTGNTTLATLSDPSQSCTLGSGAPDLSSAGYGGTGFRGYTGSTANSFTDGTCQIWGASDGVAYAFAGTNYSSYPTALTGTGLMHDNFVDLSSGLNGSDTASCNSSNPMWQLTGAGPYSTFGTSGGYGGTGATQYATDNQAWNAPTGNYNMVTGAATCSHYPNPN